MLIMTDDHIIKITQCKQ